MPAHSILPERSPTNPGALTSSATCAQMNRHLRGGRPTNSLSPGRRVAETVPPGSAARRLGIATLLLLLAAGAAIVALPLDAGAVRIGGVSVAWWYAAVLAPVASAVTAVLALLASRDRPPS